MYSIESIKLRDMFLLFIWIFDITYFFETNKKLPRIPSFIYLIHKITQQ